MNKKLNNNVSDINKFIEDLKNLDFGVIQTIAQLNKKLKIDITESRELVINSPSWIEEKEIFIDFNNKVYEILEREADKVDENSDGIAHLTFFSDNEKQRKR
ncbi:hypothetical protein [Xanthomarina spongicola]|uniref:Uncharacterized protein n=1 Tax=Xanthomarina spongicola TaxID=570520 RepID=A0A316DP20_9FLAO|nr:hypothetical protein [Xanthomarina spongicola]PWK19774.1 hypothetical protein LX78_01124 [Xanthomarina spongicola]